MPNYSTTPLASGQLNHDYLSVELVEPDRMPAKVRIAWPPQSTLVDRSASPTWPRRSPNCLPGRILCLRP
jgi:hypothetical protein